MNIDINCINSYRCWECNCSCLVKQLFLLPESIFYTTLHDSYATSVGLMIASGLSVKQAEEIQNIKIMSLITARIKFIELNS